MGTVLAVCISEKKGVQKRDVGSGNFIPDWGIENDAHAGHWHRQVSLLSADKIEDFRAKGADVVYGDFGENLVVSGFDFRALPVGTLLRCGDVLLEMTQIGKECHSHCAIFKAVGDCIMPREGVFARVLEGGVIKNGDEMEIVARTTPRPYQAAVITLSDKGAAGEREDTSGPAIKERLESSGYEVVETLLLPDGRGPLKAQLIRLCDQRQLDLILTTGGTGFTPRDVTPEATREGRRARGARHSRGDTRVQYAVYAPGHVLPRRRGHTREDADCKPARQHQGRPREHGRLPRRPAARAGYAEERSQRLREEIGG